MLLRHAHPSPWPRTGGLRDAGCSEPATSAGTARSGTAKPERCWERAKGELGPGAVLCSRGRYEGDRCSPGPILQGFSKTERGRERCAGSGGLEADRSPSAVTFHSFKCLGFLQISSGFPGAFLFFSNYRGLQLVLADPCACTKYHCCQPDLQVCAGIITGLGLKASLGDFLPLIFDVHAQRRLHLPEAFSLGTP